MPQQNETLKAFSLLKSLQNRKLTRIDTTTAAKILNVVPTTVSTWCSKGKLHRGLHWDKVSSRYILYREPLLDFVSRAQTDLEAHLEYARQLHEADRVIG